MAVQGFGKVGALAAQYLADAGCRVVAVSDAGGAVVRPSGLDVAALRAHAAETGTVHGYRDADALSTKSCSNSTWTCWCPPRSTA